MTEQLPLPLQLQAPLPTLAQFDFSAQGPLQDALGQRMAGTESSPLLLSGAPGTGKSHLLAALSGAWQASGRPVRLLPLRALRGLDPEALGLDGAADTLWLLDDLDGVLGQRAWELALFELLNRQHDAHLPWLATTTRLPEPGGFLLPDLGSRLQQAMQVALRPLDDGARHRLLVQRAGERGLVLADNVLAWLDVHWSRDLSRQLDLLADLDRYSLSRGRRLNLPLVREWLARSGTT